ncbi:MAG: hypothetical protein P4L57_13620 [Rhizomicrobium sp.]|nr:hypothetical protein [Rhizomicrobium sp.]
MTAGVTEQKPELISPLPIWLMGFGWSPVGVGGAVTLMAMPQLLSAQHVPEAQIAALTAFALAPGFVCFLFGPLLDWRFRRKSYAIGFFLLGGLGLMMALLSAGNLAVLAFWEFLAQLAISIGANALGGWFSSLVPKKQAGALGAWFTVWNIGAGGATAMVAVPLIRATSLTSGAILLGIWSTAAVILLAFLPCKAADGRLAHESIKAFASDVATILKSRIVLWTLLIFLSPVASFALTNVVGGLGRDFATGEATVSLLLGIGAIFAGIVGSLAMPQIERWVSPRNLYLWLGLIGAIGSAMVIVLPRTPLGFAIAAMHENIFQSAGFAVAYAIALRTIGPDDPLAATQFSLLSSAICLPLTYMQIADANGYARGGVSGAFAIDAVISGAACVVLLILFRHFRKIIPPG